MKRGSEFVSVIGKCDSRRASYCINSFLVRQLYCRFYCKRSRKEIQGDTKKRELLKNPTKIEEIQEKKLLTDIEPLKLAF